MSEKDSQKNILTEQDNNSDNVNIIWLRLCKKAAKLRYGSFTCQFIVHQGEIRKAEYYDEREHIT